MPSYVVHVSFQTIFTEWYQTILSEHDADVGVHVTKFSGFGKYNIGIRKWKTVPTIRTKTAPFYAIFLHICRQYHTKLKNSLKNSVSSLKYKTQLFVA